MPAFTMPNFTSNLPPAGGFTVPADYWLVPAVGTTLRVSWTADRLVSFRGFFKNVATNTFLGFQSFVNNNGGNWLITPVVNGTDEFAFGIDTVNTTGVITFTYSVDSGRPYSVVWDLNLGKWVAFHRASDGKFCSVYFWNGSAWRLHHS